MSLEQNASIDISQTSVKPGRIEWLDVLRGIAMYLVVIGHASEGSTPDTYRFYIYSFHMPLFFMISGASYYLQTRARSYSFYDMAKNKARTLLLPYFTLNFIAFWIWILNFKILSHSDSTIREKIYAVFYSNEDHLSAPSNATWFLTTLFLTILVFYLLQMWSAGNETNLILAVAILGVAGYAMSLNKEVYSLPWHIDVIPMALIFFLAGYLFIVYIQKIENFLGGYKKQIVIFSLCILVGYICARYNAKVSMASKSYGLLVLFLGSSFFFSFALVLFSMWIPKFRILKFIGRNTIVCLAFHAPIFRFIEVVSDKTRAIIEGHPILVGTAVFVLLIPVEYIFEKYFGILLGRKTKKKSHSNELEKK